MRKKSILLISGFRIFPAFTGGHLHSGVIGRALARMGFEVTIYSLAGRREDYGKGASMIEEIEPGLIEETHLGWAYGVIQVLSNRLGVPRWLQYQLLRLGWVPKRLKQRLAETDLVICDLPIVPPVPGPWRAKPHFMISHNLEYRLLESGSPRERRFVPWLKAVEAAAPKTYTDIFCCAEEDHDFFRARASADQQLPFLRSGVDPYAYERPAGTREAVRTELGLSEADTLVVFAGSGFRPNAEALVLLKDYAIRDAAWLAEKRIYFLLLGTMESAPYRKGALIATGRVPDTVRYFVAADAGLNPVTTGSGANVKLFEYLVMRLPVLCTPFGARGLPLEVGRDYLLYDPADPRAALEALLERHDRAAWRVQAEAVWQRHRADCDLDQMVRRVVEKLPHFAVT